VFCSSNGWTRAFLMKSKSEAHEALSLLFARDGVPAMMIMDGAREQAMGDFRRKCREVGTHVRLTEPHTPWSNAAEGAIRELKKGLARKMVRKKSPKKLWDDCLELEAYIRSNIAHEIYGLKGEVPETIVSGETSDISAFAEYEWYQWIKFRVTSVSFPEDSMVLGRYLGPSIDIGPAMTAKILKSNGQSVHRSTLRALTQDEIDDADEIKERESFDKSVQQIMGDSMTTEDYMDNPEVVTPDYEPYEDDDGNVALNAPDADDIDVETYDQYIGAEVMLQRGDT